LVAKNQKNFLNLCIHGHDFGKQEEKTIFLGHTQTICKEFREIWFSLFTPINEVQQIEKNEKKKKNLLLANIPLAQNHYQQIDGQ
jgi:uncharacterized protein YsxB (DUF464 family)